MEISFDRRTGILASSPCSKITLGFSISLQTVQSQGVFCIGATVSYIQVRSGGIFILFFSLLPFLLQFDRPSFAKYYIKLSDSDTLITIISRRDYKRAVFFQCDPVPACLPSQIYLSNSYTALPKSGGYQPAKTCLICPALPCPFTAASFPPTFPSYAPPPPFNC